MTEEGSQPKLAIISGPSGSGKSTVVRELLERCPLPIVLSVSATTRPPRKGEQDGVNYHFLTREEFEKRRQNDQFIESETYGDNWYGTLRNEVTTGLKAGKWVLLEIEVKGAFSVLESVPDAITIFVHAGSLEEIERRLRNRDTDTEESIQRRLELARSELAQKHKYKHEVINDRVDRAVDEICDILKRSGD